MLGRKRIRNNQLKKREAPKVPAYRQALKTALATVVCMLATVAMSILFIFCYQLITQSDYFHAKAVYLQGNKRLTKQAVLHQAQISENANTLAVNLALVRKHLLAHPWIAEAEVQRELPDTIHIRIREHKAVAVIKMERTFLLNASGHIFKEAGTYDANGLPVIEGLRYTDLNPAGQPQSIALKAVTEILRLGHSPASVLPNASIRRIKVDPQIGIALTAFKAPKMIQLGFSDYQGKYKRLHKALRLLKRRQLSKKFQTIDVSHPDRTVLIPAEVIGANGKVKEV